MKQIKQSPEPPLGDFELLVLVSLLRLGPEAYGASVRRDIEARTGRDLSISAVYITIDRLEAKGLVRTRIGEPTAERGGRRRKHATITAAGQRALRATYESLRAVVSGLATHFEKR